MTLKTVADNARRKFEAEEAVEATPDFVWTEMDNFFRELPDEVKQYTSITGRGFTKIHMSSRNRKLWEEVSRKPWPWQQENEFRTEFFARLKGLGVERQKVTMSGPWLLLDLR